MNCTDPIIWKIPSADSSGSMPIGNGEIGANVWAEPNGDILVYLSKSDAWSGLGRLLKVGRVRLTLTPNPWSSGAGFEQELNLEDGILEIRQSEADMRTIVRLWVDAHHPVLRVSVDSEHPVKVAMHLENLRPESRLLRSPVPPEVWSETHNIGSDPAVFPPIEEADTILPPGSDSVAWEHRNGKSPWETSLRLQSLEALLEKEVDPLRYRVFGGLINGTGFVPLAGNALGSTEKKKRHELTIHLLTLAHDPDQQWREKIEQQRAAVEVTDWDSAEKSHRTWWHAFWQRSYICISGPANAEAINQTYALNRYLTACAGRGNFPIKFNGSLFTADWQFPNEPVSADYRRWGGGFWFQNTRLSYWPMLAAGDFEFLPPLFKLYQDALPLAEERVRRYFGCGGAAFPETISLWGAYLDNNYGHDRSGLPVGKAQNTHIGRYFSGVLELLTLGLDLQAYHPDDVFWNDTFLPLARPLLQFFGERYPRDAQGTLHFEDAQVLEQFHDAINPLPEIAGLQHVLTRLLALPESKVSASDCENWQALLDSLPPVPTELREGKTILAPAGELLDPKPRNGENPQLYAVFPYRLHTLLSGDLELARETFHQRVCVNKGCWGQDGIHAASLGLVEELIPWIENNLPTDSRYARFPGFWTWERAFDWIPDVDHCGAFALTLQKMLLQGDAKNLLLLPAWPADWNVAFKLHAPGNTVVEAVYSDGKLRQVQVDPSYRTSHIQTASIYEH